MKPSHYFRSLLLIVFTSLGWPLLQARDNTGNGQIKGVVTTRDGKPAADVTVTIKQLHTNTLTAEDGSFVLRNIMPGTYELSILLVGHQPSTQTVTVQQNATAMVSIKLDVSDNQLEEVVVLNRTNKFGRKESDLVARMPLKNMENPQVYSIVSSELLKEQVNTDFKSTFKNMTGVSSNGGNHSANGRYYTVLRGFNTANAVRNGLVAASVAEIDPVNVERMEVIKGPSGTLFGSLSSFGGVFNRVTKKPLETFQGNATFTTGSWGLNRFALDINTPINNEHTSFMRVNAAAHSERSFQDYGTFRTYTVAPSFAFKPNEKVTVYIDGEFYNRKGTPAYALSFPGTTKVTATSADQLKLDYNKSYGNNSILANTNVTNLFGEVDYTLSSQWKSQTVLAYTNCDFYYPALTFAMYTDSTLGRNVRSQFTSQVTTQIQQNFIGDFTLGGMRNRVVAGVDVQFGKYDFPDTKDFIFDTLNYINPGTRLNAINIDGINQKLPLNNNVGSRSGSSTMAAYVSDVLNLTDRLLVMGSVRYDRFKSDGSYTYATGLTAGKLSQSAFSPKLGITYQAIKNQLSFFANYMNGFQGVSGTDFYGKTFKPQYANQAEAGMKADLFNGKLVGTVSFYNISVTNTTRADVEHTGFSIQDGTQKSQGAEVEIAASPFNGMNLLAGYSYNDSKLTKAAANIEGKRPAGSGAYTTVNAWASYRVPSGALKGLGIGAGANYSGMQYISNTSTFRFTIPSFTTVDGTLFYDTPGFRVACKVDNMGSTKYWSQYTLAPGAPARVSASFTYKFK